MKKLNILELEETLDEEALDEETLDEETLDEETLDEETLDEETLDFENPQVLSYQELFTMASDLLYFSDVDIISCAASKYGYKIADKYCSNTLMKMLYEDKYIDEWCYATYKSIIKTLKDFSKDKGFEDEEDLRIKLLAIENLLNELTSYLCEICLQ